MRIWNRIRYLLNRRQLERELAEELRIHAEMVEDELRRGGLPQTEARQGAERTMGNVVHALEDSRARWNFAWIESLLLDVRYALRSFRRTPIFAGTVIGTIGLALGLNTALFSIFNAYVLRPFAVRDPYSIYELGWTTKRDTHYLFTAQELENARSQTRIFSEVLACRNFPFLTRAQGQYVWGAAVSGNYFTALGVGPALGRTILPRDDGPQGNPNVLVLSYTAWKEKFGGAADITGKTLRVRGYPFEVIGVARPEFGGLTDVPQDFWVPLAAFDPLAGDREPSRPGGFEMIGRLKPEITLEQAKTGLTLWARQQTGARPDPEKAIAATFWPRGTPVPLNREMLLVFSPVIVAFGLVLLIACANVANMMLARAMARQREIGIRLSLGAGRLRLVRQLLAESLLLALPAGIVGFVIASGAIDFGVRLMFATMPPEFAQLFRIVPLAPDFRVFAFVLIAAGIAALAFGLAPALQVTRPGLMYAMRGDFSTEMRPARLRNGLIVSQVTVCVLLLICAGILLRAANRMQRRDIGIETRHVLVLEVQQKYHAQVGEQLASEPVVESVAAAWRVPFFDGLCAIPVTPAGRTDRISAGTTTVSPEYFSVFRIPLLQGRTFTIEEARARAPVVIVSEATARRFWPARDALGQTIRIVAEADDPRCKEAPRYHTARVIGVAKNVTNGITAKDDAGANCLYFAMDSRSTGAGSLLVTVKGSVDVARRDLDRALARTNPGAVDTIIPMQQVIAALVYPFRVSFWISSLLGILALVLTVSGIYGVMSYLVSQRTKEIGIRMALGANTAAVLWMVLKQSMKMAALGITAGVVLAAAASRLLASQMEMVLVNTFDVVVYAGGVTLVTLAAVAASYIPSRRAAQIDPSTTLRFE